MSITIALAGNPNCGKTTLFNALTGSNQFVGNWPGVTVEKKEGKLKKHSDVTVTDLPGIYSLSPYTLEEVVARNYLIDEHPDAILNIIDGTNLERNLYLTTQLTELGIPVVLAINMMDIVEKNGDHIDTKELSRQLGCRIVKISALKGTGIHDAAEAAIEVAKAGKTVIFDSHECYPLLFLEKEYIPRVFRSLAAKLYKAYETYVVRHLAAVVFPATMNGVNYFEGRCRRTLTLDNLPELASFPAEIPNRDFRCWRNCH